MADRVSDRKCVNKSSPCPVCRGTKRCAVCGDGTVFCRGCEGDVPGYRRYPTKEPGCHSYVPDDGRDRGQHRHNGTQASPTPWPALAEKYRRFLTPARRDELAADLGVPAGVLNLLMVGWNEDENCWTFPSRDAAGQVIGIKRRWKDGRKFDMKGGHSGIFVPQGWENLAGPILLPEGPTNVLALLGLNVCAIGRPNNCSGVDYLAAFLKTVPPDREIIVLGDIDAKSTGRWPGKEGAESVSLALSGRLGRLVSWVLPPGGYKDVREWYKSEAADPGQAWEKLLGHINTHKQGRFNPGGGSGPAPAPEAETFTAADLMAMQLPPPSWAVEGVIPDGLSVIAGKPKLGKSWLVLHLAHAVSCGGVALGKARVKEGPVLYISLEDTKRRLKDRLGKLLGPDKAAPAALHLAHVWPRQDRGGLAALDDWLARHPGCRLVVIDTWGRWRPFRSGKGDNYDIDYADGAELKALADKHGVSIVVVHHCRKMPAADPLEEVSGSVGLTGACDGVLVLRRERGQHDATLMVTGRDVDEAELALVFDGKLCLWQFAGPAQDFRVGRERQAVLDLFDTHKELSCKQVVALTGKRYDAVRQLLSRMARDGQLRPTLRGTYCRAARDESQESQSHKPATGVAS